MRDLARLELLEQGLELIDETGDCPLCDTSWPEGELEKYLKSKREKSQEIGELKNKLNESCSKLLSKTGSIQSSIERIINITKKLDEEEKEASFQEWHDDLSQYNDSLLNPMEKYLKLKYSKEEIKNLFLPEHGLDFVQEISKKAQDKYPELTPEQRAWDTLTEIETNLKGLEDALLEHKKNQFTFCTSRDSL